MLFTPLGARSRAHTHTHTYKDSNRSRASRSYTHTCTRRDGDAALGPRIYLPLSLSGRPGASHRCSGTEITISLAFPRAVAAAAAEGQQRIFAHVYREGERGPLREGDPLPAQFNRARAMSRRALSCSTM